MALNRFMRFGVLFEAASNLESVIRRDTAALNRMFDFVESGQDQMRKGLSKLAAVALPAVFLGSIAAGVSQSAILEDQLSRTNIAIGDLNGNFGDFTSRLVDLSGRTGITQFELAQLAEVIGEGSLAADIGNDRFENLIETSGKFAKITQVNTTTSARFIKTLIAQNNLFNNADKELKPFLSALLLVSKESPRTAEGVASTVQALLPLKQIAGVTNAEMLALAGSSDSFGKVTQRLLRSFGPKVLGAALQNNGERMAIFARELGMADSELRNLIENDPFEFFLKLTESLVDARKRGLQEFTRMSEELGLNANELSPLLIGMGNQVGRIRKNLAAVRKELQADGSLLDRDYQKVIADTLSQLNRLSTQMTTFLELLGRPFLRGLTIFILRPLNAAFRILNNLLNTTIGQLFIAAVAIASLMSLTAAFLMVIDTFAVGAFLGVVVPAILGFFVTFGVLVGEVMVGLLALAAVFEFLRFALGPAISFVIERFSMLVSAIKAVASEGGLSLTKFKALQEAGLVEPVIFIVGLFEKAKAFANGFFEALAGFEFEDIQVFRDLAEIMFMVLRLFGVIGVEVDGFGFNFKTLGKIVGGVLRGILELINLLIRGLNNFTNAVTKPFLKLKQFVPNVGQFIGRALGRLASPVSGLPLIGGPEAVTTGASPATGAALVSQAPTSQFVDTFGQGADIGLGRVARGEQPLGAGGSVFQTDLINNVTLEMDGARVGGLLQRRRVRTKKNQGAATLGRGLSGGSP